MKPSEKMYTAEEMDRVIKINMRLLEKFREPLLEEYGSTSRQFTVKKRDAPFLQSAALLDGKIARPPSANEIKLPSTHSLLSSRLALKRISLIVSTSLPAAPVFPVYTALQCFRNHAVSSSDRA